MTLWTRTIPVALTLALQGCAAGSLAGAALDLAGIRKAPELPDAQKPPRSIAIRLHAATSLNTDAQGHPLALVARIYKLRQGEAFQRMAYAGFIDPAAERAALGNDLLEVREVMLIPGQRYETVEKVTREAYVIGVVGLFRAPAPQRWRLAFPAADAEKNGITVGLYACALGTGEMAATAPLSALRCE